MSKDKERKKRKKKKRKFRKLFVSTAAFITAAVVVVFCIYHVYFETDYFNISAIEVSGNEAYNRDYIVEKSQIEEGEKIFEIDRKRAKEIIEDEVYVESARVVYELPDKILIQLREREEKYKILYKNEYIVTDKNGYVLRTGSEKNELLTIESFIDVLYNVGDSIQLTGIEDVQEIFRTIDYISDEFGSSSVRGISIYSKNSILLKTEYGTFIKLNLNQDIKYQIVFALKIINERFSNNLGVSNGMIDFTKGDSPIYIEDFEMEEYNE